MTNPTVVLLVEDDPLLRDAFRLLLEDAGYRILEAGSAREALARVEETPPDLVLLDLGLPDRPGLEVARELRAREETQHTRIVALTGRVGPAEQRACLEAGCARYIAKPVEPKHLLGALRELFE